MRPTLPAPSSQTFFNMLIGRILVTKLLIHSFGYHFPSDFSFYESCTWISIINPITYPQSAAERLLNEGGYVIISAGRNNKMLSDRNMSDEIIQERTVNLTNDLTNLYAYSSMQGVYNGDNETSFFVTLHNISPDTERSAFIQLGEKYNQESIIYVKRAIPTIQQFIYTTGVFSGKYVEGQGYEVLTTNVTDDYSELTLWPNGIFKFILILLLGL
ncbi:unnamed protein product [Rotaria sp. Silwood1]|nr:unnamed protein product [Rotaria sp. Silwood1]